MTAFPFARPNCESYNGSRLLQSRHADSIPDAASSNRDRSAVKSPMHYLWRNHAINLQGVAFIPSAGRIDPESQSSRSSALLRGFIPRKCGNASGDSPFLRMTIQATIDPEECTVKRQDRAVDRESQVDTEGSLRMDRIDLRTL